MLVLHFFYLVTASLIARVLGQTPPGTQPSTNKTLAVSYGGIKVTPGIELPLTVPRTFPTITYPTRTNHTYQLLFIDLSISTATLNTTTLVPGIQLPLAPGITPGRTTRLHYWQTGLTFSPNGTLLNTTTPIAFYQPPAPPLGDIAHTYVFYLFEQDAGFAPPPAGNPFSAALVNKGSNRLSFNVGRLAGGNGNGSLVGANYFTAQNRTATAKSTGSAAATGSVSSPTGAPFLGNASRSNVGLAGVMVTALVMVFALV